MFVIVGNFQGKKPIIIADVDGEPHVFPSFDSARDFTCSGHIGLEACDNVHVLDMESGEVESY